VRFTARESSGIALARVASTTSRALGRGKGEIIGGRVALQVAPSLLASLAAGRTCVLVTGTNGKSTTTALVDAALSASGPVVSNRTGANMPDGIVTALDRDRESWLAALEVDEAYLGPVVRDTAPAVLVVLNLYREYTRGVSLGRTLAHWREVASRLTPSTVVVANVDDPLVQYAFEDAPRFVPVSGGLDWTVDAELCPACHRRHAGIGGAWECPGCGRARRQPIWSATPHPGPAVPLVHPARVEGPGRSFDLTVRVPGRTASTAAMMALVAAHAVGADLQEAARRVGSVMDVDGRYRAFDVDGRHPRILMLKNPAGWGSAIDTVVYHDLPVVIAAEPFGPRDMTTLWEAPWERLQGRAVRVSGARAYDVRACLESAGVATVGHRDVLEAVRAEAPGDVVVACNYPAFRRLTGRLRQTPRSR
jgi:lipid II isoglutaminyl synthase (glutamine-hydrolysing)